MLSELCGVLENGLRFNDVDSLKGVNLQGGMCNCPARFRVRLSGECVHTRFDLVVCERCRASEFSSHGASENVADWANRALGEADFLKLAVQFMSVADKILDGTFEFMKCDFYDDASKRAKARIAGIAELMGELDGKGVE